MGNIEINSFPKIWTLGAREAENIFKGPVEVTEKIDGSQFAFGKTQNGLIMRSKGNQVFPETADKLFKPIVDYVVSKESILPLNTYFYGETLCRPRHNTLQYERVPLNNFALFGVNEGGKFANYQRLKEMAEFLTVDVVPVLYEGEISNRSQLDELLKTISFLGRETIEGVVIKNHNQLAISAYSPECFVKLVREEFKERNNSNHPTRKDMIEDFLAQFKTEARWNKALQHLNERGEILNEPKDIGKLIVEVQNDIFQEEESFIRDSLYDMFKKKIAVAAIRGLPEWYKGKLTDRAFEQNQPAMQLHAEIAP